MLARVCMKHLTCEMYIKYIKCLVVIVKKIYYNKIREAWESLSYLKEKGGLSCYT